jgi:hypothetical protein
MELRSVLQIVWSEQARERAGLTFVPGEVVVSVKGGEIVEGGAPLDLIVEKVQIVQSLFYRTAELLSGLPHRKRGPAARSIQETCRPWLFQTAPGSYQFAVAIQDPKQQNLFGPLEPSAEKVAAQFLHILRASSESPEDDLRQLVPSDEYRSTFLALTRNLAPTGRSFDSIEVRATTGHTAVRLDSDVRLQVNNALRQELDKRTEPSRTRKQLSGVLRAVHLDKDWIEVTVDGDHIRVTQVSEAVDDVIGPMVNKAVLVHVLIDDRGNSSFVDIELTT